MKFNKLKTEKQFLLTLISTVASCNISVELLKELNRLKVITVLEVASIPKKFYEKNLSHDYLLRELSELLDRKGLFFGMDSDISYGDYTNILGIDANKVYPKVDISTLPETGDEVEIELDTASKDHPGILTESTLKGKWNRGTMELTVKISARDIICWTKINKVGKFSDRIEVLAKKSTLPANGLKIEFKDRDGNLHKGDYSEEDKYFYNEEDTEFLFEDIKWWKPLK